MGRWQDLKLMSPFPETIQYQDTGKELIFKGKSNSMYYVSRNGTGAMPILAIPSQFKNLSLSSESMMYLMNQPSQGMVGGYGPISLSGNVLQVSNPSNAFGGSSDTFFSGIIINYGNKE